MNDKIHKDEIEWLVSVYKTSIDEEVTKEAYEKLIGYGLTDKQIQDIFEKTKSEEFPSKAFDKAWAKQAERNEVEKYTTIEMIKVFFLGPYAIFHNFNSGLKELWDYNYKTKFRQRLILLISGIIFWILFAVGAFKYYEYKPKMTSLPNERTLPQADTLSIYQQEHPQQKGAQQALVVNQNSLEDVIVKTIKAYQTQNEKTLNELILKKFGIAFVYRMGAMDEFSISDKISFDEPIPDYLPFDYNIITTDYKIHFGKLPVFSCETEKWNKSHGIYCDTINTDKTLSNIAKFRNENFESNYSDREMKKIEEVERKCYVVIVIGKEGNEFVFSLTFLENKWYLTIIDRFEPCSA